MKKAAGKPPPPVSPFTWVTRVVAMLVFLAAVPVILGLPVGRRLFWTVAIASVPLFFTVFGFYLWRRVCPLAVFGQLGRIVGAPGKRKAANGWRGTTRSCSWGSSPLPWRCA